MPKKTARSIHGIILLDKWLDASSNAALQHIKRLFNAKKAGHTGSLDPLATGMLPICFGRATKFCQFLLDADKSYQVTIALGMTTTTGDAEGDTLLERPVPTMSVNDWENILASFRGPIMQVPSMYSALKHKGKPLYEYARKGIDIPRPARPVHIHALNYVSHDAKTAQLKAHCSKGTYIRTLAEDIGKALGCGAHVTKLRRDSVGPYPAHAMHDLASLQDRLDTGSFAALDECLLPISSMVSPAMPKLTITQAVWQDLEHGKTVHVPGLVPSEGLLQLQHPQGGFWGIGEIIKPNHMAAKRLLTHAESIAAT